MIEDEGQETGAMVATVDTSTLGTIIKAETDTKVATAKAYPRSIARFQREVLSLCTLNEQIAEDCLYALPRTDKDGNKISIEGPSIRMAEILMSCWGNCAVGTRVLDAEGDKSVVAQGVFVDYERNATTSKEVRRRITSSNGRRYNEDMVNVTANAAASIAARNAILAGIPQALWTEAYESAKKVAAGSQDTLEIRRAEHIGWLAKAGVTVDRVFLALDCVGVEDIDLERLVTLKGLMARIKAGENADAVFPRPKKPGEAEPEPGKRGGVAGAKAALGAEGKK